MQGVVHVVLGSSDWRARLHRLIRERGGFWQGLKEILLDALLSRPASLPVVVRDHSGIVEGVVTGRTGRSPSGAVPG